jgi:predicted Zn finger-like uncharacterized protein
MVISVQCPSCSTTFPVDTAKVPEEGVYARCSVCAGVFFVERAREAMAQVPVATQAPLPRTAPPEPWTAPSSEEWQEPASDAAAAVDVPQEPSAQEWGFSREDDQLASEADMVGADVLPPLDQPLEAEPPHFEMPTAPLLSSPSPVETPGARAPGFTFGRRDPHEKARRLARVLVSDMIMYNPERHTRALAAGSLREDFDEEIRKSWHEYVEQVGEEIARGTSYFDDALNDILAQGQRVFP